MKVAGLIGGVAWPSTLGYYKLLNEGVQRELGGLHSARCVIVSLDFACIHAAMAAGRPADARAQMETAARQARRRGRRADRDPREHRPLRGRGVQAAAGVPLVHVARETGDAVAAEQPRLAPPGRAGHQLRARRALFGRLLGEGAGFELVLLDAAQRRTLDAAIFGAAGHAATAGRDEGLMVSTLCNALVARGAGAWCWAAPN